MTYEEIFLKSIATGVPTDLKPVTREQMYLARLAGQDITPPTPVTADEMYLSQLVEGGGISSAEDTIILVDENGVEVAAYLSEEEVDLNATANDIRAGTYAVTNDGVTAGEKDIPSYHTTEGYELIQSGSAFAIPFGDSLYDFTKLQVIICPWTGTIAGSVAAEKVSLDENVYAVNSTESLATVTKDSENYAINLNITNESESVYVVRYFTYKEVG